MNKSKIALFFLCGLVSGIFVAQGLIVLAGRTGGNFGGEIFVLPLIVLLIYMGVMIGRMFPDKRLQDEVFREGYMKGQRDYLNEYLCRKKRAAGEIVASTSGADK